MINTLHIKNMGIIDDITINLNEGFNVLTGETGAGKTLIIGSLQILAGGRFSKEIIRNGQKTSFVEISLYLPERGFEDDNVIVSREININGKNICKINGRLVTVNQLKEFMSSIMDIHGQNENQAILDINTHIELLDEYASKEIKKLKKEYAKKYEKYVNLKSEINKNYGNEIEKQRTLDLLNYQLTEIENANLKDGEEEDLENKRKLIISSEKISTCLNEAETRIKNDAIDSINAAIKAMEKIEQYDEEYLKISSRLKECYYEVQEAARDISYLNEDNYYDEEIQNENEERLNLIKQLKRKYGTTISEILEYKEKIDKQIYEIENMEHYIKELKKERVIIESDMANIALEMNKIRVKYSEKLSSKINKELKELEMKNATFCVKIDFSEENNFNINGLDKVEFLISTNIGEKSKPLVKIASGGEMSRIMLAIKSVLADIDKTPIIIFDEIDTGISGIAANATGEKIKRISKKHQVICVTHLASIAAKGDFNYFVYKQVNEDSTNTNVKLLNEDEVLKEIARISTGKVTDISLNHAKELRKSKIA